MERIGSPREWADEDWARWKFVQARAQHPGHIALDIAPEFDTLTPLASPRTTARRNPAEGGAGQPGEESSTMNIAVLIGVSDYKAVPNLPACAADVDQMRMLLTATGKYADIRCITAPTEAGPLKEALRGFFAGHRGEETISEALVYFSGHGVFHNDALLSCSDFDPNRPASTSLSNAEIDDLLRSVAPDVAVKIIDACQSGSPYIKDAAPGFGKALGESRLKSFICMASSRADQSSYAGAGCSLFTDRLIDAALLKTEGTVLYRDIQAALADAFVGTPEQTPFFVVQGTGLDVFASVTPGMRSLAAARLKTRCEAQAGDPIADRIRTEVARLDELYVSDVEARGAVARAGTALDRAALSDPVVSRFYGKSVKRSGTLAKLPGAKAVAAFAEEQGWAKKYLVRVQQEEYRVRVPRNPMAAMVGSLTYFGKLGDEDTVLETRLRPSHLESTQELPFEAAEVLLQPKGHPSLSAFVICVGIVHSLTEVLVLWGVTRVAATGWNQGSVELSELHWRHKSYLWKDVVPAPQLIWSEALRHGEEAIRLYLEGLLAKKEGPPAPAPPAAPDKPPEARQAGGA